MYLRDCQRLSHRIKQYEKPMDLVFRRGDDLSRGDDCSEITRTRPARRTTQRGPQDHIASVYVVDGLNNG